MPMYVYILPSDRLDKGFQLLKDHGIGFMASCSQLNLLLKHLDTRKSNFGCITNLSLLLPNQDNNNKIILYWYISTEQGIKNISVTIMKK